MIPESSYANGHPANGFHHPDADPDILSNSNLVSAPYWHIASLPSKGIREMLIGAVNRWFCSDIKNLKTISDVINLLHNSSLLLDDIEDRSQLRRGRSSAHCIFGRAQTINSATHAFTLAFAELLKLPAPGSAGVFIEEVQNLHIGQQADLWWRDNFDCPTIPQYLNMVEKKTGGLFMLAVRLMGLHSASSIRDYDLSRFVKLFSQYFQIRDDYQNLMSQEYTAQKGYCEDLDEGKMSMPLIYLLRHSPKNFTVISILQQRSVQGSMPDVSKRYILEAMQETGALARTGDFLAQLEVEIGDEVRAIEEFTGVKCVELQKLMASLSVKHSSDSHHKVVVAQ
ncbi:geranylgeranyl pyrophosphate synthase [Trichoderma barbatum]